MREIDRMELGAADLALSGVDDVSADPGSREDRVRIIMTLMADMRFEKGVTSGLLADRWGLHVNTVSSMAGEADRRLKCIISPEYVRTKLGNALDKAVATAIAKEDVKGLAMVARAYGEISGASAPKKREVTGAGGAPFNLPPRAALLLEAANKGDTRAQAILEAWIASNEPDAPALPETSR